MRSRTNAARILALVLSLFTVYFVVLSTSHIHPNGESDAACRLCQATHVGISTSLSTSELPVPLVGRAGVERSIPSFHPELFLSSAFSRAPPSA